MTSNLGSSYLVDLTVPYEQRREQVLAVVREHFRPEFLNRLDGIVTFEPLDREQLAAIALMQVDLLQKRLNDRRITLELTDDALAWLSNMGFDPIYGARPLRRLVQTAVGDKLARGILSGEIHDGDHVKVATVESGQELVLTPSRG
jgi:ATP-dependent Clp protease ATP-binding subunit ClpB